MTTGDDRSDWVEVGDTVDSEVTFRRRSTGALADPQSVTCVSVDPDDNDVSLSVDHISLGVYHAELTPDRAGVWRVYWTGSGTVDKSARDSFLVREPIV